MRSIAVSGLIIVLLTGCTPELSEPITKTVTVTKIVIQKEKVPGSLLVISKLPEVPKDTSMQDSVAKYIIELYTVATKYKSKLEAIKVWNK